jgi:O-antigen ligase/tetratricopeptide (TPR) repeat protein
MAGFHLDKRRLVQVGIMALPFSALLGVYSGWVEARLALQIVVFSLAALWLSFVDPVRLKRLAQASYPLWLMLALLTILALLSSFTSVRVAASAAEFGQFLSYIALFFLTIDLVRNEAEIERFANIILIVGSLMGLVAVYFYWGQTGYISSPRMNSMFGNKNHFAGFLLLILPLAVVLYLHSADTREQVAYGATAVFLSDCFILTYSRGAWLSLLPGLFLIGWAGRRLPLRQPLKRIAVLLVAVMATAFLINSDALRQAHEVGTRAVGSIMAAAIHAAEPEGSLSDRFGYWQGAIRIIGDHPLLGTGLGTFKDLFLKYQQEPFHYSKYAHNYFLQMGAEMGVIGLILAVELVGAIGWRCYNLLSKMLADSLIQQASASPISAIAVGLSGGLLASTIHNLVDLDWYIPAIAVFFWAEAGLIFSISAPDVHSLNETAPSSHGLIDFLYRPALMALTLFMLIWSGMQAAELYYLRRGIHFGGEGALPQAIPSLQRASQFNVLDAEPHRILAEVYLQRFQQENDPSWLELAIAEAEQAVGLAPYDVQNRWTLARIYLMADVKQHPTLIHLVIEQLEAIVDMRRPCGEPQAYQQLGKLYLALGRQEEARQLYQRIIEDYSRSYNQPYNQEITTLLADVHLTLGQIHTNYGEQDEAQAEYEAAIALQPQNAAAYFGLGLLDYKDKDFDAALAHFQQAVRCDPNDAPTHYYLGLVYLELREQDKAKEHFEAALLLNPGCEECAQRLELLKGN